MENPNNRKYDKELSNNKMRFHKNLIYIIFLITCTNLFSNNIRVSSINLNLYNNEIDAASEIIANLDSDVIILLEWTGININRKKMKAYNFILDEPRKGTHGIGILIKKHLTGDAKLIPSPYPNPCAMPFGSLRIKIEDKYISILAVHPPPPISVCEYSTKPTVLEIQKWVTNGKLNIDIGSGKINDLLVIAGDFNSFSFEDSIKNFKKIGMIDSMKYSNQLYRGTWSPSEYIPKLIRIDFIFVSKYLKITNSKIFKVPGSDHNGITSEIQI